MNAIRIFLALLLLAASAEAIAVGSVSNVTIGNSTASLEFDSAGHFFIYFSSPIGGSPPSCASNTTAMVFDGTTAAGAVKLSMFLTWYALGKTINGYGKGTCLLSQGYEDGDYFFSAN